jgi:hypothetical protein
MDIFSTSVLNRVVRSLAQPSSFLLDLAFRDVQTSDTQDIHFDVEKDKPRITPFVSPLREGKVVRGLGGEVKTFRPAYAKDKRYFDPSGALRRELGEQIGGSMTPQQRQSARLNREIQDQLRMLTRREEVMAAQALTTGTVTVAGEGYPEAVVDFGRASGLTKQLTGGAAWDTATTFIDNLEDWAEELQDESGAVAQIVIMDPKAWRLFRKNDEVKNLLDTRRGSGSSAESGPLARGTGSERARRTGTIGTFEFWVYQDKYIDPVDGQTKQLIPDNTLILLDPMNLEGTRAYGVIQDEKSGFASDRFFSKSWLEEDPAIRWLMLQSAPLVVPYRVNASMAVTVIE